MWGTDSHTFTGTKLGKREGGGLAKGFGDRMGGRQNLIAWDLRMQMSVPGETRSLSLKVNRGENKE